MSLLPYVRYYWTFKSKLPSSAFTFPVGCTQIIIHKQSPLYIPELDIKQGRLTVSGQVNFSSHLSTDGDTDMIVVVFHPHTMSLFLNVPTDLFYNQEVDGCNLENKSLNELFLRVSDCEEDAACVTLVEKWLLHRIMEHACDVAFDQKRIGVAIRQMFIAPQTPVTDLSAMANIGKKQFERLFKKFVGINPKEYARIVRFQKALMLMQAGQINSYAQIACASGYADQSHFIREFKRFSGYTPLSLQKISRPYSGLFTNPV